MNGRLVCLGLALSLCSATCPDLGVTRFSLAEEKRQSESTVNVSPCLDKVSVAQALNEKISLEFKSETLENIAKSLRKQFGIMVTIDRGSRDQKGADPNQLVSCELKGLSLRASLENFLPENSLDWLVINDALIITTTDRANARTEVRFYNVSDLTDVAAPGSPYGPPPYYPSTTGVPTYDPGAELLSNRKVPVPIDDDDELQFSNPRSRNNTDDLSPSRVLEIQRRKPAVGGTAVSDATEHQRVEIDLVELIESSISADWKAQPPFGAPIRRLSRFSNMLVIRQTQRVHREIDDLLCRLRTEMARRKGESPEGLVTRAYPLTRIDDQWIQLLKSIAIAGAVKVDANPSQQVPEVPERGTGLIDGSNEKLGEALVDLIEPQSWKKNGGPGEFRLIPGAILVRQSPAIHGQIQKVLSALSPFHPGCPSATSSVGY